MRRKTVVSLFAGLVLAIATVANGVTATTDMNTLSATDVAQTLVGPGVTISNVTFTGDPTQGGTFTAAPGTIGFDTGVVLSSGNIANTIGPNTQDGVTTNFGGAGDPDLTALSGFTTFDAAVLEFEFTPDADKVFFRYVFASDEYNEYVNTQFNDTFAFFVNGVNCAVVDDGMGGSVPITVNTINGGNPLGTDATNPSLYRNNDLSDGGGTIDTEMDGLTVVLTCEATVNAGVSNTMKLAIADASDQVLDSAVFLEEGSLSTTPPDASGDLDILPTSCPNPFKLGQRGQVPAAILGSDTLDAADIDPSKVELTGPGGTAEPTHTSVEDVAGPDEFPEPEAMNDCGTDGPDGFDDLTLKFSASDFEAVLGSVAEGDVVVVEISAETFDGDPITGSDIVWIK